MCWSALQEWRADQYGHMAWAEGVPHSKEWYPSGGQPEANGRNRWGILFLCCFRKISQQSQSSSSITYFCRLSSNCQITHAAEAKQHVSQARTHLLAQVVYAWEKCLICSMFTSEVTVRDILYLYMFSIDIYLFYKYVTQLTLNTVNSDSFIYLIFNTNS